MSEVYNSCNFIGRIKKLTPIMQTPQGHKKEFMLKVPRYQSDYNKPMEYDYFKVIGLNKMAEYLEIVLKEDQRVLVSGEMQIDKIKEKYYPYLVLAKLIHLGE